MIMKDKRLFSQVNCIEKALENGIPEGRSLGDCRNSRIEMEACVYNIAKMGSEEEKRSSKFS